MRSIFVDIDGTLADCTHRLHHLIEAPDGSHNKDWDAFHKDALADAPIQPVIDMLDSMFGEWFIILITGRAGNNRPDTLEWLKQHKVYFDALLMRPAGDHTPDVEIKRAWLNRMRTGELTFEGVEVPELVIEDRKKVVEMWREEGLIALQCDVGAF